MQIKISNEEHFQILSTNFTIGASNEGYTLMFSADGNSFSQLFTVGAGVERMVTDVANGAYYFLSGNASEVTVNYQRECHSGGGGGEGGSINNAGSATNPVYTSGGKAIACNQYSSGHNWGIVPKVREDGVMEVGKHLDFHETADGTSDYDGRVLVKHNNLYFSDGQSEKRVLLNGDGGYTIVDKLPSNAQLMTLALDDEEGVDNTSEPLEEGQMAWLKTQYQDVFTTVLHMRENTSWNHLLSFYIKNGTEQYELMSLCGSWEEGSEPIFYNNFDDNFIADGRWHSNIYENAGEGVEHTLYYSWQRGTADFYYYWDSQLVKINWQPGIKNEVITQTYEVVERKVRDGAQYIYSDEYGWKRNAYNLDAMTVEERANLIREVANVVNDNEEAFIYPITFKYSDKSYWLTNVYADDYGIQGWSINGDTKRIIKVNFTLDGNYWIEEGDIANPPVILDLNRMEDWERRNLIDSVRYYREELGQTFPEPIIFNYNDITYRASEITAFEGYLEATTVDPISRESVGAFIDENGNLVVSATGGVYHLGEEMPYEDLLSIYNEIKNNLNDGIYAGIGVFYAMDESGRVVVNTVRMIEGWEEGTEDWIQMFAWTYQDGSQYIININMHYVYETGEITYEYSRNAI